MTIVKNPRTGRYEGDFKARSIGRLHLSLRTTKIGEARTRHSAVEALIAQGYPDLVARLRKGAARPLSVLAVARVHQAGGSFEELRERTGLWPTIGAARDAYLAAIEAHPERADRTHALAAQQLGVAVEHFGEDRALDTITGDDVVAYRTMLRTERGISDNTLGTYLTRLGALYRWIQKRENRHALEGKRVARTLYAPVDRELVPKFRATRVRFLSETEAQRLYVATPPRYRLMVALGLYAGLRLMEALMLRPVDVDLTLGLVHVQARETPHAWAPKGRKNRDVPASAPLADIVGRHGALVEGAAYLTPLALMVPEKPELRALPIGPQKFRRDFAAIVRRAGMEPRAKHPEGVTYHTLRHTFASWSVMEGVDLFTLSRLMGHSSIDQVEQTYGHLAPEHKRRAVEKLAARLSLPLDPEEATS